LLISANSVRTGYASSRHNVRLGSRASSSAIDGCPSLASSGLSPVQSARHPIFASQMLLRIRGWISKLPCRKATATSQTLSHLPFCKKKRLNVNGCLLSRWLPYKLLYSRLRSTLMDQMGQKWCREFFWPSEMDCNRSSDVSIPPDNSRKIGDIQWPASPPGDPHRDFVTASAEYLDKPGFSTALATVSKATRRSKAMVFVHGFNNRFDDAAYRLAQIVQDSKAPVIPVLFSWPSRGVVSLSAYNYDRESAS